jgi:hypothetical protein
MLRKKDTEPRKPAEDSGPIHRPAIDSEVLDVIREEKRKGTGRGPSDAEIQRKKRKLAQDGLRAIRAKDARAFSELLRLAGIPEGSPEWRNAWKAFDSA